LSLADLFGFVDSRRSGYLDLGANIDLRRGLTLNVHAGRQQVRHDGPDATPTGSPAYPATLDLQPVRSRWLERTRTKLPVRRRRTAIPCQDCADVQRQHEVLMAYFGVYNPFTRGAHFFTKVLAPGH
jgi:hypothetical protein